MNKNKIIIGLFGKENNKIYVSSILENIGFQKIEIKSIIENFEKKLLKKSDFTNFNSNLSTIRNSGYKIMNNYWINLLLTSIPKNKSYFFIPDIQEEDVVENIITPYYIIEKDDNTLNYKNTFIIKAGLEDQIKSMFNFI